MKVGDTVLVCPFGKNTIGLGGRISAIELNHILVEFPGQQNMWGGPVRTWYARALVDSVLIIRSHFDDGYVYKDVEI